MDLSSLIMRYLCINSIAENVNFSKIEFKDNTIIITQNHFHFQFFFKYKFMIFCKLTKHLFIESRNLKLLKLKNSKY